MTTELKWIDSIPVIVACIAPAQARTKADNLKLNIGDDSGGKGVVRRTRDTCDTWDECERFFEQNVEFRHACMEE